MLEVVKSFVTASTREELGEDDRGRFSEGVRKDNEQVNHEQLRYIETRQHFVILY
jgi:hypothetical protein